MRVKVSEAPDRVLNYLVAKLDGHSWRCPWMLQEEGFAAWMQYEDAWGNPTPDYCNDWAQGGPIIDRERGTLWATNAAGWRCKARYDYANDKEGPTMSGPTPLVAAMRCFVISHLGDEVEVPEELLS